MLSERPEELSDQFWVDNMYTAEKLQKDEVGAKLLRQIRHEDGKKIKRSICGSLELMNQYQKDLNEKDKRMRRAARRERHEAKKKLMNKTDQKADQKIGENLSQANRNSRGQVYSQNHSSISDASLIDLEEYSKPSRLNALQEQNRIHRRQQKGDQSILSSQSLQSIQSAQSVTLDRRSNVKGKMLIDTSLNIREDKNEETLSSQEIVNME